MHTNASVVSRTWLWSSGCSIVLAASLGAYAVECRSTHAADSFDWLPPAGGSFHGGGNWTPVGGPPGLADTARFLVDSLPGGATVTFARDVANQLLFFDATSWIFDLGGWTYAVTGDYPCATLGGALSLRDGTLATAWAVALGNVTLEGGSVSWSNANGLYLFGGAEMTLRSGSSVESGWFDVVGDPRSEALLHMEDGAVLACPSSVVVVGSGGKGALRADTGAIIESLWGEVGSGPFGLGTARLSEGSHWGMASYLVVGFHEGSEGLLLVESGASIASDGGFVGREEGSDGVVVLSGFQSSWSSSATVTVGVDGQGLLDVGAGASVSAPEVIVGTAGALRGDGIVSGHVINHGLVAPGPSESDGVVGDLHIGTFSQSRDGRLTLDFAGVGPGQFDRLVGNFSGTFQLGGTLEIALVDGFVPQGGEAVVVLTGGFMGGTFASLVGPVPFTFTPGEFLGILTFCMPADLNCDGVVNGGDLGLLLSQWDGPGTGDLNHDGIVDGADVGLLLAAWSG